MYMYVHMPVYTCRNMDTCNTLVYNTHLITNGYASYGYILILMAMHLMTIPLITNGYAGYSSLNQQHMAQWTVHMLVHTLEIRLPAAAVPSLMPLDTSPTPFPIP